MSMTITSLMRALEKGLLNDTLCRMYGRDALRQSSTRILHLLEKTRACMGSGPIFMVCSPGRTELGGNHTDHNHGRVLAAAIDLDIIAIVQPTRDMMATVHPDGFGHPVVVDLTNTAPITSEQGTSEGIVRGVADGLSQTGYKTSGFTACTTSTIPIGAGLSSSAAFGVLTGRIFNYLCNFGSISALDIARIARRAENLHFGKPCGFMDQIACSLEGVLSIDFFDPNNPTITPIDTDVSKFDHILCVVNTGGSHADLTPDYAAIPAEMHAAAAVLGKKSARGLTMKQVMKALPELRDRVGERAILRLMHFIEEDERAAQQVTALQQNDMKHFLNLAEASGRSSTLLLQNCFSPTTPKEQPIPLALTLTNHFLQGQGACRIHGGGFAGTIQAFVPRDRFKAYTALMENIFGAGAVIPLSIRHPGHELLQVDQ